MKSVLKIFLIATVVNYLILVLDNFFFKLFEGKLLQNFVWIFVTEFDNPWDPITIFAIAFLIFIPV